MANNDLLQVEELLAQLPLFRGLEENALAEAARGLGHVHLRSGERLFSEGEPGSSAFIVRSGQMRLTQQGEEDEVVLVALMGPGDIFGEEALIYKRERPATAIADGPAEVLEINSPQFNQLLSLYPHMRLNLVATAESHRLAMRMRFDWLGPGEVVHLVVRKHPARLVLGLLGPAILLVFSLPFFFLSFLSEIITPALAGGALLLLAGAWGAWSWIDWGNDYYIVTSQRVVWLERVIALYDSRQEAPLRTVLSVGLASDVIGRILGYGDVVVRTYTGRIIMRHVGQPAEMAALVEQYWLRTRRRSQQEESELIQDALRKRLGLEEQQEPEPEAPPAAVDSEDSQLEEEERSRPLLDLVLASLIKMRYEEGSVITYRKHWYLLLRRTWLPGTLLVFLGAALLARLLGVVGLFSLRTVAVVVVSLGTVVGGWLLYEFVDWRNDMYQLTTDHIVDIDKKPLGTEQKRSAPLENVLSLDYEREGLLGLIFNFGNVNAQIGATLFTFDGVHDPAQVQQDIFMRMDERRRQKEEAEANRERERMAEWLATYHRNIEEYQRTNDSLPSDQD
jgi:hypothetical protein